MKALMFIASFMFLIWFAVFLQGSPPDSQSLLQTAEMVNKKTRQAAESVESLAGQSIAHLSQVLSRTDADGHDKEEREVTEMADDIVEIEIVPELPLQVFVPSTTIPEPATELGPSFQMPNTDDVNDQLRRREQVASQRIRSTLDEIDNLLRN